jgi:hypothetical protein
MAAAGRAKVTREFSDKKVVGLYVAALHRAGVACGGAAQ